MKQARWENMESETRIINFDRTSHERSQGQVEPLRKTASGTKH